MNYGRNPVLRRILEAFFRHRALFFVSLLLITGIVAGSLLLRGRTYQATASIYVVPETEVATTLGFARQSYISPAQQHVNHFNDLMRDDAPEGFLDVALRAADLSRPISVDPKDRDARFDMLKKRLWSRVDSGELFTIGLTWDNPAEAERIVAAFRKHYIDDAGLTRQAQTIATVEFLTSEIGKYEKRMRSAEGALNRYKQENSGRLPESQSADIEQLARLRAERAMLTVRSRDAEMRRKAIEERLAVVPKTAILQQTVAGTAIGPKQKKLEELQAQKVNELNAAVPRSETSSLIRDLDARIARLKAEVKQEVAAIRAREEGNVVEKTTQDNPEYLQLNQQLTEAKIAQQTTAQQMALFAGQIAEYEQRVRNFPAAAKALSDRTRDYTILKAQFEDLLQRREQARIKANLDKVAATSTLEEYGIVFAKPTATGKKMMLLGIAALVTGLVVGVGLIVLGEWLDPSLRYDADAERFLGVPILAALPQVGTGGLRKAAIPGGRRGKMIPATAAAGPAAGGAE